jgi:hypothetical protein
MYGRHTHQARRTDLADQEIRSSSGLSLLTMYTVYGRTVTRYTPKLGYFGQLYFPDRDDDRNITCPRIGQKIFPRGRDRAANKTQIDNVVGACRGPV